MGKVSYSTSILKFDKKGEKTGWTYVEIPETEAHTLKPDNRKSFRVKGLLDDVSTEGLAIFPMGDGGFILPLNKELRKKLHKQHGDSLRLQLEADTKQKQINAGLLACLNDEPEAVDFFKSLPPSHQRYFSNWIESAKTELTQTKKDSPNRYCHANKAKLFGNDALILGRAAE